MLCIKSMDAENDIDDPVGAYFARRDDSDDGLLKLWQALCLEFGLAQNHDDPTTNPNLPPLPLSKTKARELLSTRAHVNIVDYLNARAALNISPVPWGAFKHLVHPSRGALVAYIRKSSKRESRRRQHLCRRLRGRGMNKEEIEEVILSGSKMFPRELAKSEGLQPLLCQVF
ncbi:hypothetical protein CspeluHIS016_0301550 [Cutaneotrichosporon spelunceum]|uniref:Uncharacterized protein n=1 Tax=Cutaneotrichosporon spelunceum TaxID=1672016 RepID=A0AAD3YAS4_9TREE|nr:hypothetical protein CspeluHIS016_0301550 [Cutaneotrichosporon spelunceum]